MISRNSISTILRSREKTASYDGPTPVEAPLEQAKKVQHLDTYIVGPNMFRPSKKQTLIPQLLPGLYNLDEDEYGCFFTIHQSQNDTLLRFDDPRYDDILNEIDDFWARKHLYEKYGFAHKRGVLLYGEPGTGKSCLLKLITEAAIGKGYIVLIANYPRLLVSGLKALREIEPERPALILLEDLDDIINNSGERTLLELFDGDSQTDNVLYLGTTNYVDRLPARMLRPSRFDRKLEIGNPPAAGRRAYFSSKLVDSSPEEIENLVEATDGMSFAQLREFVVSVFCLGNAVESAVSRLVKGLEGL